MQGCLEKLPHNFTTECSIISDESWNTDILCKAVWKNCLIILLQSAWIISDESWNTDILCKAVWKNCLMILLQSAPLYQMKAETLIYYARLFGKIASWFFYRVLVLYQMKSKPWYIIQGCLEKLPHNFTTERLHYIRWKLKHWYIMQGCLEKLPHNFTTGACIISDESWNTDIWTTSRELGTYRLCEQRRFRRACTSAQSRQNLRCSLIQAVNQEESSDRKPDPWPLWMAGHAQLKFVMTECSKTQIRLAHIIQGCLEKLPSNTVHSCYLTLLLQFSNMHFWP